MIFLKSCLTALATLLISGATLAATIDVGGAKIEDSADVQGSKLQLNGAGIRYKAIFKVYAIALYAGKKFASVEELTATPGNKRISMTMLRDIDTNDLGKAFTRGFEDNSPKNEMSRMMPGLIKMSRTIESAASVHRLVRCCSGLLNSSSVHHIFSRTAGCTESSWSMAFCNAVILADVSTVHNSQRRIRG